MRARDEIQGYSVGFFFFGRVLKGGKKPLYYCWPDTHSVLCLSSSSAFAVSTLGPTVALKTRAPTQSQCAFRPMQHQVQRANIRSTDGSHGCLKLIADFEVFHLYPAQYKRIKEEQASV